MLDAAGTELLARRDELGRLLAREEGKTLAEAVGEVARAGQIFRFLAGEALRLVGQVLPSVRPGVGVEITREPLGVVGPISPWNLPVAIPAWKTALAHGNAVVLKPADPVPGCADALAGILMRAGLPAGLFNLVLGPGGAVGRRLVEHPDVAAIWFTGSLGVGRGIAAGHAAGMKKVQPETGGKNPMVVLDDADPETAVAASLNGAFFSTGQRCTASSRLIVTEGIHDRFVARLTETMGALRVGPALDPSTQIGPVVGAVQLASNLKSVDIAASEGGTVTGGGRVNGPTEGDFTAPALVTGTDTAMRINRAEVFGPVAGVIRLRDFDEALAVANDTDFGLSAGICTASLKHATAFKAQAGTVMVNLPGAGWLIMCPSAG